MAETPASETLQNLHRALPALFTQQESLEEVNVPDLYRQLQEGQIGISELFRQAYAFFDENSMRLLARIIDDEPAGVRSHAEHIYRETSPVVAAEAAYDTAIEALRDPATQSQAAMMIMEQFGQMISFNGNPDINTWPTLTSLARTTPIVEVAEGLVDLDPENRVSLEVEQVPGCTVAALAVLEHTHRDKTPISAYSNTNSILCEAASQLATGYIDQALLALLHITTTKCEACGTEEAQALATMLADLPPITDTHFTDLVTRTAGIAIVALAKRHPGALSTQQLAEALVLGKGRGKHSFRLTTKNTAVVAGKILGHGTTSEVDWMTRNMGKDVDHLVADQIKSVMDGDDREQQLRIARAGYKRVDGEATKAALIHGRESTLRTLTTGEALDRPNLGREALGRQLLRQEFVTAELVVRLLEEDLTPSNLQELQKTYPNIVKAILLMENSLGKAEPTQAQILGAWIAGELSLGEVTEDEIIGILRSCEDGELPEDAMRLTKMLVQASPYASERHDERELIEQVFLPALTSQVEAALVELTRKVLQPSPAKRTEGLSLTTCIALLVAAQTEISGETKASIRRIFDTARPEDIIRGVSKNIKLIKAWLGVPEEEAETEPADGEAP